MPISTSGTSFTKWKQQHPEGTYAQWKVAQPEGTLSPEPTIEPEFASLDVPTTANAESLITMKNRLLKNFGSPTTMLEAVREKLQDARQRNIEPLQTQRQEKAEELATLATRSLDRTEGFDISSVRGVEDIQRQVLRSQIADIDTRIESRQRTIDDKMLNLVKGTSENVAANAQILDNLIQMQETEVEEQRKLRELEMKESQFAFDQIKNSLDMKKSIAELQLKTPVGKTLADLGFEGELGMRQGLGTEADKKFQSVVNPLTGEIYRFDPVNGTFAPGVMIGGMVGGGNIASAGFSDSGAPAGGWRTDRNNNPIAFSIGHEAGNQFTKALDDAGIAWEKGDPFPDGSRYTVRVKGDPVEASRAVLANTNAIQGWYLNHTGRGILPAFGVSDNEDFAALDEEAQNAIIAGIYKVERGNGSLLGASPSTRSTYLATTAPTGSTPPPTTKMPVEKFRAEEFPNVNGYLEKAQDLGYNLQNKNERAMLQVNYYAGMPLVRKKTLNQVEDDARFKKVIDGLTAYSTLLDKAPEWAWIPFVGDDIARWVSDIDPTFAAIDSQRNMVGMFLTRLIEKGRLSDYDRIFYMSQMPHLGMTKDAAMGRLTTLINLIKAQMAGGMARNENGELVSSVDLPDTYFTGQDLDVNAFEYDDFVPIFASTN